MHCLQHLFVLQQFGMCKHVTRHNNSIYLLNMHCLFIIAHGHIPKMHFNCICIHQCSLIFFCTQILEAHRNQKHGIILSSYVQFLASLQGFCTKYGDPSNLFYYFACTLTWRPQFQHYIQQLHFASYAYDRNPYLLLSLMFQCLTTFSTLL